VVLPGGAGKERDPAIRTILFTHIVSTNEALADNASIALSLEEYGPAVAGPPALLS
jgi:hypothetical protein